MKTGRIVIGTLLAGLISSSAPALAAGPSAYQHGSDEAAAARVGDWFATLGASGLEKDSILSRRRMVRAARRTRRAVEDQAQRVEEGLRDTGEGLWKGMESVAGQ